MLFCVSLYAEGFDYISWCSGESVRLGFNFVIETFKIKVVFTDFRLDAPLQR